MRPDLQQQLYERYPAIFEHEPGFACGDGWFDLIDVLCAQLQGVTEHGGPQVVATQVKEKFGSLRFYTASLNDEQHGMVELAEALSVRICEVCGSRGQLYKPGWVRTRCDAHAETR
ncbi:hypothetical protein [Burkholderia vietnamiensis]|uniref:hypothetical protein n=1 Tax=Burkholderia vietnamiensis TaxID=60552 RepID=UPI001592D92C|nr:hypothetical protein [Burkholderia vietnamiensis]HDR8993915.1 hypothetical protein [Burkholderia vietnamiensis]